MRSDELGPAIRQPPPSGDRDTGMRVGIIRAWNDLTGENTVEIEGQQFDNLDAVQGGIGINYNPDDVVVVMRKQSTYFIFGKVTSPGAGAGSSVQQVTFGYSDVVTPTSGNWIDVPSGVVSVDAYIGSGLKALVIWRADVTVNNSTGEVGWSVSGASNITPGTFAGMSMMVQASTSGTPSTAVKETACGFFTLHKGGGLKKGLNTFTLKYRVSVSGSGVNATFGSPQITVVPL